MSRLKKKILIVLIVLFLIAGAMVHFLPKLNQPVTSKVVAGASTNNLGYNVDLTPVHQTGTYASYDYPKGLKPQSPEKLTGPILQSNNYVAKDVTSWVLAISVSNLPNADLNNDSSYTLRRHNPNVYTFTSENIGNHSVIIATDLSVSVFSKIAFITHESFVGTISLSGDDILGTTPLNNAFNQVISSWQWLK